MSRVYFRFTKVHLESKRDSPMQVRVVNGNEWVYGETLRARSGLDSSPLTSRWMLCNSVLESRSPQGFGEPGERLVTSESRLEFFGSTVPLAMAGMAVVRRVLSGTPAREYGLYRNRGRTAFRNGCR